MTVDQYLDQTRFDSIVRAARDDGHEHYDTDMGVGTYGHLAVSHKVGTMFLTGASRDLMVAAHNHLHGKGDPRE